MLFLIILLVLLWALGLFSGIGNLVHILLVVVLCLVIYQVVTGRQGPL